MTEPRPQVIRVYADTSVYGGVFDERFAGASRKFFALVERGSLRLVLSPLVRDEITEAPRNVSDFFGSVRPLTEIVDVTDEAVRLQRRYLAARIVGPRHRADAPHVAIATVSKCAVIVSWNFRHIVNLRKIALYNGVNLSEGYGPIAIHTPQEVIADVE